MPHGIREHTHRTPKILFLDAYDSFTNNIVALIEIDLNATVEIIKIDEARYLHDLTAFWLLLNEYDAVVAGPGPGAPENPVDIGLIRQLWELPDEHVLPVLGVCLGFQSLACAHGARVIRLHEPRHGIISRIDHCDSSIFSNVGEAQVVQYQSLHAQIDVGAVELAARSQESCTWKASVTCPQLKPLAWVLGDEANGPTLMGIAHVSKPFWGLQFHPESICTNFEGVSIIRNWWTESQKWRLLSGRSKGHSLTSRSNFVKDIGQLNGHTPVSIPTNMKTTTDSPAWRSQPQIGKRLVQYSREPLVGVDGADICEVLQYGDRRVLLLESGVSKCGNPVNAETGRFSIFGVVESASTEQLLYFVNGRKLIHVKDNKTTIERSTNVWNYIKEYMNQRKAFDGSKDSPFWGGLVGYASYESCLETINVKPSYTHSNRPDICFSLVERSVVLDHVNGQVFIQSTKRKPDPWISETCILLSNLAVKSTNTSKADQNPKTKLSSSSAKSTTSVRLYEPQRHKYTTKILTCQSAIRAGDSYELCLTDRTSILLPHNSTQTPWSLYRTLRILNPAPFSAYLNFPSQTLHISSQSPPSKTQSLSILSSSPERFLSWSRAGHIQLRPIKGTVAKSDVMTRQQAEAILSTSKEQAENLMIVDLIRHDLHGVVGAGNVKVSKLMVVEEYESVFQLVSVVEGEIKEQGKEGIDVLAASLPPGSMTGAPKKRSCEILRDIEGEEARGVYSGVLGYLDVGGGGDFSVVIRTAWAWGDVNDEDCKGSVWHVGAGGAVTSQSTVDGEWKEMLTKRAALLKLFDER